MLALAVVAGAGFALQRQSAALLQQEIIVLRDQERNQARLRADNERLRAEETPKAEVERLRADHAALLRLRTEIDQMKSRAEQRSRESVPSRGSPPALALSLGVAADGGTSLDGQAFDLAALKQRLAGLAKGDRIDVRFRTTTMEQGAFESIKRNTDAIKDLVKEFGLQMTMQVERAER